MAARGPGFRTLAGASLVNAAASLAFSVSVARLLGVDSLAGWSLSFTVAAWVSVVAGSGTNLTLRLRVVQQPDIEWMPSYWVMSVIAVITAACAGVIIALGASWLGFSGVEAGSLVLPITVLCAGLALQKQCHAVANASGRSTTAVLFVASGTAAGAGLIWLPTLTGNGQASLEYALYAYSLGTLPVAFVAWQDRNLGRNRPQTHAVPVLQGMKGLLQGSTGPMIFNLSLALISRSDRFLLAKYSGLTAVGLYSAAASIAESARLFPSAAGQVLFFRESRSNRSAQDRKRVRVAVFGIQLAVIIVSPFIVPLVFGPEFRAAVPIALVLGVAEAVFAVSLIESRLLSAHGRTDALSRVSLAVLPFALVIYFISAHYGAVAVAFGSLTVYLLMSLLLLLMRRRHEASPPPEGG